MIFSVPAIKEKRPGIVMKDFCSILADARVAAQTETESKNRLAPTPAAGGEKRGAAMRGLCSQ
jgi:hypothetical protein